MSKIHIEKPEWLTTQKLKKLIIKACTDLKGGLNLNEIQLEHPANSKHGDYSANIAMTKLKEFKQENPKKFEKVQKPIELAKLISDNINQLIKDSNTIIKQAEAVQPGFINFWLKKDYLIKKAEKINQIESFKERMNKIGKEKTVIVDYSAPNIAKPFGIGHLRSTNIGQAIYNLYGFLGWNTIGDNHLGDWGTQFGKLIVAIKKWWDKDLEELTIKDLLKLYVKFHKVAEEKPELEEEGRKWFKKLEQEDKEAKKIWQFCVDLSLKEFDRVYKLLDIDIDKQYGESFYHFEGWMDKVIKDLKKKNLLKTSQKAKIVEIEGLDSPAMVIKSDGATTYLTRDLATIKFRKEKWDPDLIVYEVGSPQRLHFKKVFSVAEKLGYMDKSDLIHVAHGLLRMKTGKLSTRKGKTIDLEEVLEEAIKRAKKLVEESQTSSNLNKKEKEEIAQAVGIGGVKFNDLKQEPEKDIMFDWDSILSMDGFSAPYLQYTYARTQSIFEKTDTEKVQEIKPSKIENYEFKKEEVDLLRTFYIFPEIIISAAEKFGPHRVCRYLFDLARKFNLFYQKHTILDPKIESEEIDKKKLQNFRLFLTHTTASILKLGLKILNIKALKRM